MIRASILQVGDVIRKGDKFFSQKERALNLVKKNVGKRITRDFQNIYVRVYLPAKKAAPKKKAAAKK
jgi:hypothetical protein